MKRIELEQAHWKELKNTSVDMAILPWGATEPHNYHLPYGTDFYCARDVSRKAVELISDTEDIAVAVLPAVPYGVNTGQRDLNLCLSIRPSVQYQIIKEIASSLVTQGIWRLMIVNGHGGNNFKPLLRELAQQVPDIFCCFTNWWTLIDGDDYFVETGDHAGEMETSCMQYLHPELVLPLAEAGSGASKGFKPAGLSDRTVWAPRKWRSVSEDTGVGDPAASTPEKGRDFFLAAAQKLSVAITEIASTDISDLYERD